MRQGASDRLYNTIGLPTEEILSLYQAQIIQELYPLRDEKGIEHKIHETEQAHHVASQLYSHYGDTAYLHMKAHTSTYVQAIGHAIETCDCSEIAM